jgi:Calpain family cysteine protease
MRSLRNWFTKRPATRQNCITRLRIEQLEARQLLSAPPGGLNDPVIMAVADAEFNQDQGQMSRSDVINLLNVVDGTELPVFNNGVVSFDKTKPTPGSTLTATQLSDLRSIQDTPGWGLAADVDNLFGKVVNKNPANEHYDGASLLPTGKLNAGNLDSALQDLVGKWFYGTDLPKSSVKGATYHEAKGTLFGQDGPKASDIAQGAVGDCYFLSMLAETALHSPQTIRNMFIDNGDGTWTVRFYRSGVPDYVTVNGDLPAYSDGEFVYANHDFDGRTAKVADSKNVLWVALAEKAYAQLGAEGWSLDVPGTGAYASLSSSQTSEAAGEQITGWRTTDWIDCNSTSLNTTVLKQIAANFKDGGLITFCLNGNHYYYMTGYDAATQTFTFVNEYRDTATKTLKLTFKELEKSSNSWFNEVLPPAVGS